MEALVEGVTWNRGSSAGIERDGLGVFVDPPGAPAPWEADHVLLTPGGVHVPERPA